MLPAYTHICESSIHSRSKLLQRGHYVLSLYKGFIQCKFTLVLVCNLLWYCPRISLQILRTALRLIWTLVGYPKCKYLYMLIVCYRRYKGCFEDDYAFELVQRLGGWVSMRVDSIDFYVPENRAELLLLSGLGYTRMSELDYVV